MKVKIREEKTTTHLTGIITLEDLRKAFKLPKDALVTVQVPGGGDWSNMQIEMGAEFPGLEVAWKKERIRVVKALGK